MYITVGQRGERELHPLLLKLTFICQGPIHKIIPFMITSGAQRNDKRVLQREPLMTQWETFSYGPQPSQTLGWRHETFLLFYIMIT